MASIPDQRNKHGSRTFDITGAGSLIARVRVDGWVGPVHCSLGSLPGDTVPIEEQDNVFCCNCFAKYDLCHSLEVLKNLSNDLRFDEVRGFTLAVRRSEDYSTAIGL